MTHIEALDIQHQIELNTLKIRQALDRFELAQNKEKAAMAVNPQLQAFLDQMNQATTAIGARIAAILANAQGLNADDQAALQAEVQNLNALAADPNNPTPAPVAGTVGA